MAQEKLELTLKNIQWPFSTNDNGSVLKSITKTDNNILKISLLKKANPLHFGLLILAAAGTAYSVYEWNDEPRNRSAKMFNGGGRNPKEIPTVGNMKDPRSREHRLGNTWVAQ